MAFQDAVDLASQGNFEQATLEFRRYIEAHPESAEAYGMLAQCYLAIDDNWNARIIAAAGGKFETKLLDWGGV